MAIEDGMQDSINRHNFDEAMHLVIAERTPQEIIRDGVPVAVILPYEDYQELVADAALMRAR